MQINNNECNSLFRSKKQRNSINISYPLKQAQFAQFRDKQDTFHNINFRMMMKVSEKKVSNGLFKHLTIPPSEEVI